VPDAAEPLAFRFDDFLLDRPAEALLRVHPDGQTSRVPLGARAFRILSLLVERRGAVVTRQEIMDAVWPDVVVEENNLSVQLSNLRRALDADREQGSCIQTLPGRGYRFLPAVTLSGHRLEDRARTANPAGVSFDDAASTAGAEPASDPSNADPTLPLPSAPADGHHIGSNRNARRHRTGWVVAACVLLAVLIASIVWPAALAPPISGASKTAMVPSTATPDAREARMRNATPTPAERPRLSLVVLPFQRLGDDVDEHAVDAIVEDLTTELSRYAGLRITARNSAFTNKGKPVDIQRAGQELGVRYAVEGSVRKLDGALRVNAQLVSAETGEQFWAERFTVEPDATGDGVDLVVWRIAYLAERRMFETESARSMRERPDHPDANDALVRAHALYNMPPSPQKQTQLLGLYERAVELDPSSAPALAGLAEALLDGLPVVSNDDPTVPARLRRAEELVSRAELLDPNEMHVMFARTYLLGKQDRCPEAIPAARRAIEAHPNRPGTEQWYGICLLRDGRAAEAVRHFEQAIRVNPRSHELDNRYRYMGQALLASGRYDEAISWFRKALAVNPSLHAPTRGFLHASIAAAQALSGDIESARLSAIEANRLWPVLTARSYLQFKTTNQIALAQRVRAREGLRAAGVRDSANEDADAGLPADAVLHSTYEAPTPIAAPGARTIRTAELAVFLEEHHPLVLDTTYWGGSIAGAVALWGAGVGGSVSDEHQDRLRQKMDQLTRGNRSMPVVTVGWNAERFQGRNLALRLVALGYIEVYWYRGGREAWMAAGLPTAEVTLQDW
jgi:adenylate cyclase